MVATGDGAVQTPRTPVAKSVASRGRALIQHVRARVRQAVSGVRRVFRPWVVWSALAAALLVASALGVYGTHTYLAGQATDLASGLGAVADPAERVRLRTAIAQYQTENQVKIWTTLVLAVGAAVLAVGGYFAFRNLQVAQRNLQATQAKLDVDREAQLTNRFTQAISLLGAELKDGRPNLEVRLGGIYALERLAKDSPKDHWTIVEVLTAYVRRNAPAPRSRRPIHPAPPAQSTEPPASQPDGEVIGTDRPPEPPPTDIQAILTVLARRQGVEAYPAASSLDLSGTDLRGIRLVPGVVPGEIRSGLSGADLRHADLRYADLRYADLRYAEPYGADLSGADLSHANLSPEQVKEARNGGRDAFLPADFWQPPAAESEADRGVPEAPATDVTPEL